MGDEILELWGQLDIGKDEQVWRWERSAVDGLTI